MEDKDIVLGIDFNNLLFTSYYSPPLINSNGMNVNAINGFFRKLSILVEIFNPASIVIACDLSRSRTFRRRLFRDYKAQRKPLDNEIINQIDSAKQICSLLGYPVIDNVEFEADDILGMTSRLCRDNNLEMVIVSSDKDMYQLLTDTTYISSPKIDELITQDWLLNKYKVAPGQWIEVKMLQGDRSDNIPGIPKIGEITALQLIQDYGNIENIYKHINQLKPSIRETLLENKHTLDLLRQLVTIVTNYSLIELNIESIQMNVPMEDMLFEVLSELELFGLFNTMRYNLLNREIKTLAA